MRSYSSPVFLFAAVATAMDMADTEVDTATLSEETPSSTLRPRDLVDMERVDTATMDTATDTTDRTDITTNTASMLETDTDMALEMDMEATTVKLVSSMIKAIRSRDRNILTLFDV